MLVTRREQVFYFGPAVWDRPPEAWSGSHVSLPALFGDLDDEDLSSADYDMG